jgi:hypothetical protein
MVMGGQGRERATGSVPVGALATAALFGRENLFRTTESTEGNATVPTIS